MGAGGDGLVFGTLLGPEATGPGFWPWDFVSGFPAMTVHVLCVCGLCGVGLLFENYIVDASILYKKQFPRYLNLDLAALWCGWFRGSLE